MTASPAATGPRLRSGIRQQKPTPTVGTSRKNNEEAVGSLPTASAYASGMLFCRDSPFRWVRHITPAEWGRDARIWRDLPFQPRVGRLQRADWNVGYRRAGFRPAPHRANHRDADAGLR